MFLKDVESWLKRGQNVTFLREICPRKKVTPKYNAASGIIAGELLKGCVKLTNSLCADSASVRPSYIFRYSRQYNWEPASIQIPKEGDFAFHFISACVL
jgi:hypothetical protein